MATKTRSGCQQCRKRHLKCDQATPICGRCQSFGRVCTKNYVYRFHKDKFADDQKWLSTSDDLTFVDETQGSMRARSATLQTTIGTPTSSFGQIGSPTSIFSERHTNSDSPTFSQDASPQYTVHDPPTAKDHDDDNDGVTVPQYPESPHQHILQDDEDVGPLSPIYLEVPVWPLEKHSEVLLLRHFVQNLAIWLDLCDPQAHFQVVVPQRAGTCRVLLNAIFALSARHLSRTGNYDSFASNIYHQECLRYLIPMLNDTATVSDENLFAATIILRVLEEMDAPETESESHRLGIQVFVSARDPYAMGGGLSEAAFWVGLRQEIYSALMEQKSVQLNLEHTIVDRSDEPTSDFGWANRAVVLCADVLNCCFGDLGVSSGHWMELKARSDRWEELRPPSFIPVYRRDADRKKREAFPEIWFVHPCQIIGIQHQRLAQILLAIFDPSIPRIGVGRNTAVRLMEEKIKPYLRELCGLGLHNRWTPPGMFTASMGIALCGDRFTDRIDQEALLNVLVITEKDHARPTAALQQQMIKAWGWISED